MHVYLDLLLTVQKTHVPIWHLPNTPLKAYFCLDIVTNLAEDHPRQRRRREYRTPSKHIPTAQRSQAHDERAIAHALRCRPISEINLDFRTEMLLILIQLNKLHADIGERK